MDASNMDDATLPDVPDASMMDPTIEDLFGEAPVGLDGGIAMPQAPLPAPLILRIAEMQSRGCCTKLAWSNTGSIAQISPDGSQILFRAMVRDQKSGNWTISEESKCPVEAPEGRQFVHIQFNGIGIDLAAIDNVGQVHMYTLTGALGKMMPANGDLVRDSPHQELNAIVGMHWLALFPAEFRGPYIDTAHKVGDRWDAQMRQRDQHSLRAHHPADGRHAFLYVSRSTELTLCFQNEGPGWQSTSVVLDTFRSSAELISHAALGEDGADLLAATYDYHSRLRLYRVSINWNASQHSRVAGVTYTMVQPTLDVHHLTAVTNALAQQADSAKLTHLQIIPAVPEAAQTVPTLPTVLAVYTYAAFPADAPQMSFSAISRWRVESSTPSLHESFVKLKPGGNANQVLNQSIILRRQPDVVTQKVILTFESQIFDTILAFGYSDGSLDLRDRVTMNALGPFGSTDTVSNLPQCGFDHLPGPHNLHLAMSGDGSALALIRMDKTITASSMAFTHGWQVVDESIAELDNRPFIEAAAVCVARQYAFLCYNNMSNDETLALLPRDVSPEIRSLVVKMIFRMLNRSPDISVQESSRQQMIVLKEPLVPRTLSAQLALGTDLVTGHRNYAGQYAYVLLTLRLAGTALASTFGRQDVKSIKPETVHYVRGLVKWCIDLIIHIANTLVNVQRDLQSGTSPKQVFDQLISTTGNPSLHLLLCSFSRALLRSLTVWIGKYFHTLQAVQSRAGTFIERQEMLAVLELATKMPFRLSQFEQIVIEFDTAIRTAYAHANLPNDRRGEIEITMMVDGSIPPELEPAVDNLITAMIPKFTEKMDLGKLFFWDTAWLQLDQAKARVASTGQIIDVQRKLPLPDDVPLRVCRRCGSEMEDIRKLRPDVMGSFVHSQRHCVCMNYWILAQ